MKTSVILARLKLTKSGVKEPKEVVIGAKKLKKVATRAVKIEKGSNIRD